MLGTFEHWINFMEKTKKVDSKRTWSCEMIYSGIFLSKVVEYMLGYV